MTNITTPQEALDLIDRLADKELIIYNDFVIQTLREYNCLEDWINEVPDQNAFLEAVSIGISKSNGSPIYLHNILAKVKVATVGSDKGELIEVISLWEDCGFERSLQDIAGDVEEVIIKKCEGAGKCLTWNRAGKCASSVSKEELTPSAQALFTFIKSLNL